MATRRVPTLPEEWSRGTRGRGLCAPGGSAGVSSTTRGLPGAAARGQLLSALTQAPAKIPKGEQVRRVYDVAQTPLQRLLASGVLPEDQQRALRERVQQIDPLALSEHLDALRHALLYAAHLPPLVSADGRAWPQLRFSLEACTSVPRPPSEEEPEQTDYQEAPSSSEDILSWLHKPHGPMQASGRRSCLCSRPTPSGPAPRSCRRSGARPLIAQSPHPWRRSFMVSAPSRPPLRANWRTWPPELIQGDHPESRPTELHSP